MRRNSCRRKSMIGISALLCVAFALGGPSSAVAQSWPSRPLTVILPLAPGTGLDIVARTYSERLAQTLGRPVVVDNKPGGAQVVAVNALMAAAPDGHTMLVVTSGALALNPSIMKKLPYDPQKDFIPISFYVKSPFVLVVNPQLPIKTVPDLIQYIKARPGKVSYSSAGSGSAPHLAGALLAQRFGLEMTNVPYKISAQGIADVAAGHVELAFAEAGASQSLIRDGKLRALAVSSRERFATLPDVPPFAEAGNAPDFEAVSWHMLLVRSNTPREIVNRLHQEMQKIMREPDVQKRVASLGLIPVDPPSIEETQRYIAAETEKWGSLVKKLGLEGSQ
jgi:tripartite-type tricarboxylate transporter receptor subunit TctC